MRLIHQTEINDCGVAVCCMILNHFGTSMTLEGFKIEHKYNHEAYSFAIMTKLLQAHQIKSESYAFENFQEVRDAKALTCFQVVNSQGMLHFVLGEPLSHHRWRIYDPGSQKASILSEKSFVTKTTGKLQFYYPDQFGKSSKQKPQLKFLWKVFKLEWFDCLCGNLFIICNLLLNILLSSFLRVVFVDAPILTLPRIGLLLLGLSCLLVLNFSLTIVLNLLNQKAANQVFRYFLNEPVFESRVTKSLNFLLPRDFERLFAQYQRNLLGLVSILNQSFGFIVLVGVSFYYFFQASPLLMFSSLFLIILLCTLNFFKRKWLRWKQQANQDKESYYFYELENFINHADVLTMKTSFRNYCELKQINHLYLKDSNTISTLINVFERWLIYFYYLALVYLINRTQSQLSLLFIYTSIVFVFVGLLDNFGNLWTNYQFHNYFQSHPEDYTDPKPFTISSLSFEGKDSPRKTLVLKETALAQIKINNKYLMDLKTEIYDARTAINFEDSIYNNLFNYQKGDVDLIKASNLMKFMETYNLDFSQKPTRENAGIISYLSCFFTSAKILILKRQPENLKDQLSETFPEKVIIFVDE